MAPPETVLWSRYNALVLAIHAAEMPNHLLATLQERLPEFFGRPCTIVEEGCHHGTTTSRLGPFEVLCDGPLEECDRQLLGFLDAHIALAWARISRHGIFGSAELTSRQRQVLPLVLRGLSDAEIAGELGISVRTAEKHVAAILKKFRLPARARLIARFGGGE